MVTLSVMITSYELAPYIKEALESVLMQETDFETEILVGDDGSTDGTLPILEGYEKEGKIRLFRAEQSRGENNDRVSRAAANRLRLLKEAKGRYACFLDGDDWYTDKGRLKRMVDTLEKPENADCIMCATNLWMSWPDGRRQALSRAKKERKILFTQYWPTMFLQSDALLFRNIYGEHPPKGSLAEQFDDNEICFWLFCQGKMYYLPECSVAYRQLPGSSWDRMSEAKRCAVNLIGYGVECETKPDARRSALARCYPSLRGLTESRGEWEKEELEPWLSYAEEKGFREVLLAFRCKELNKDEERELKKLLSEAKGAYLKGRAHRILRKLTGQY